jgi:hypothetical protein
MILLWQVAWKACPMLQSTLLKLGMRNQSISLGCLVGACMFTYLHCILYTSLHWYAHSLLAQQLNTGLFLFSNYSILLSKMDFNCYNLIRLQMQERVSFWTWHTRGWHA